MLKKSRGRQNDFVGVGSGASSRICGSVEPDPEPEEIFPAPQHFRLRCSSPAFCSVDSWGRLDGSSARLNKTTRPWNRVLQRDVYLCWPIAPSYMSPNAGGGGGGELWGLTQWVQLDKGVQINFGDLTLYNLFLGKYIICIIVGLSFSYIPVAFAI